MDGQSEQRLSSQGAEMKITASTHITRLVDLSKQYFHDPIIDSVATRIDTVKNRMTPFIEAVEEQYASAHSTIREVPKLQESFRAHNNEVLETAIFFAQLFGLPEEQHATIAASAALHDIAKADPAPTDVPDNLKSDYTLLMHPESGAKMTEALLKKSELAALIGDENKTSIVQAIRCHSGPIPGFMQDRLDYYNAHSKTPIQLIEIDPTHTPSIMLLAADMLALGSPAGVKKIVQLREQTPHFRIQDVTATVQGQRATTQEVRVDSALKSAYQGAEMVRNLMKMNPTLERHAESIYRLMTGYFEKTKAELLQA